VLGWRTPQNRTKRTIHHRYAASVRTLRHRARAAACTRASNRSPLTAMPLQSHRPVAAPSSFARDGGHFAAADDDESRPSDASGAAGVRWSA
jgi:hypothetical protein